MPLKYVGNGGKKKPIKHKWPCDEAKNAYQNNKKAATMICSVVAGSGVLQQVPSW
jgi:hypothetical protein